VSIGSFLLALLVKHAKKLSAGPLHSSGARGKNEGSFSSDRVLALDMICWCCLDGWDNVVLCSVLS